MPSSRAGIIGTRGGDAGGADRGEFPVLGGPRVGHHRRQQERDRQQVLHRIEREQQRDASRRRAAPAPAARWMPRVDERHQRDREHVTRNVIGGVDRQFSQVVSVQPPHRAVPWFRSDASLTARAKALAFFCHDLDGGAQDPAAKALLTSYCRSGNTLDAAFRRELTFATRRWRAEALPAFGRRSTRSCRHTEVPDRRRGEPRWHWHLGTGGEDPAVRDACANLAANPPAPQKSGRRGGVWIAADLVMKVRQAGAAKKLWRASYWLAFAQVATAAPVALRTFRGEGSVFYRRIANESLAHELATGRLDGAAVMAAARSLGNHVGRLHAHGLRNRDLKFDNLVRDPATNEIHMVDLDGILRKSATDVRGAGADLGRLLAAFRGAGSPGGPATIRTFLRAWQRAHRQLQQQSALRKLLRRAEQRAGEWAEAHRDHAN
jgi:tRNA A-37 threonylcarbamoyl transferase component Bud32